MFFLFVLSLTGKNKILEFDTKSDLQIVVKYYLPGIEISGDVS